jgi:hypothetical protein
LSCNRKKRAAKKKMALIAAGAEAFVAVSIALISDAGLHSGGGLSGSGKISRGFVHFT